MPFWKSFQSLIKSELNNFKIDLKGELFAKQLTDFRQNERKISTKKKQNGGWQRKVMELKYDEKN